MTLNIVGCTISRELWEFLGELNVRTTTCSSNTHAERVKGKRLLLARAAGLRERKGEARRHRMERRMHGETYTGKFVVSYTTSNTCHRAIRQALRGESGVARGRTWHIRALLCGNRGLTTRGSMSASEFTTTAGMPGSSPVAGWHSCHTNCVYSWVHQSTCTTVEGTIRHGLFRS